MLRSLHIKLVLIMILLVVCLMAIAGAFLINSVNRFYLNEFYTQMVEVFSEDTEFVRDLVTAREGEQDGGEAIDQILLAKMGPLGVDGKNRNYYILDGETAEILASSDDDGAQTLEKLTPNLLIALNEKREGNESDLTANYMDLALPIQRGGQDYIIYKNSRTVNLFLYIYAMCIHVHSQLTGLFRNTFLFSKELRRH